MAHGTIIATPIRISPELGDDAEQETTPAQPFCRTVTA
jgi:hypothetical protein